MQLHKSLLPVTILSNDFIFGNIDDLSFVTNLLGHVLEKDQQQDAEIIRNNGDLIIVRNWQTPKTSLALRLFPTREWVKNIELEKRDQISLSEFKSRIQSRMIDHPEWWHNNDEPWPESELMGDLLSATSFEQVATTVGGLAPEVY